MPGVNRRSDTAERIKQDLSARAVGQAYGLHANRAGYARCLFHAEDTPSLKLYDQPGRGFHCFGCHTGGSVIDLTMRLFSLDYRAATVRLATDFGIVGESRPGPRQAAPAALKRSREEKQYDEMQKRFLRLVAVERNMAPGGPEDEWNEEWCAALHELPRLEYELDCMRRAGHGRKRQVYA